MSVNGSFGGSKSVSYNALGNIITKSDVGGTWTYDPVHVHAVKTTALGSYTYDANGNQLTGPNRLVHYTSYNQPLDITQNGKTNSFVYDGEHLRVSENTSDGTTIILHPRMDQGVHFEEVHKIDGTVEQKNFIYAGKEFIAVYTARPGGTADTRYYHKDHLGSVDTITNETGAVVERLSYDAWGKRRSSNWTDATGPIASLTRHGFTGHEMLDDVGLINMNGRVYDPTLGRFMQADPTVQSPGNPQTLNRYAYAGNNPLTYVDPSGYGWFSKLWKNIIRPIIAIAAAIYVGAYFAILSGSGIIGGMIGGFVGGFVGSGGNMQAAYAGAITGGIFGGIGDFAMSQRIGGAANWGMGEVNSVLAHAVGGGVTSVLQGGKFGIGAISAGFSEGFSPFYGRAPGGLIGQTVAAATVGGTAARIGGGKFENGAKTAAYAYMFNSVAHAGAAAAGAATGGFADAVWAGVRGATMTVVGAAGVATDAVIVGLSTLLRGDTTQYINHYTDAAGYTGITRDGVIRQSIDGNVYLTPDVYGSGSMAQARLALSTTPMGYFKVPVQNVGAVSSYGEVSSANGQPGGGYEVKVPRPVSIEGATWVSIGP